MQEKRLDPPFVQHQEENEEDETEQVQTKRASSVAAQRSGLGSRLQNLHNGEPLPASTRALFEPRFGADFGHVRVHSSSAAVETAQQINAQAFTRGRDIVFGPGRYQPQTLEGQRLLAHELTHVVQQGFGGSQAKKSIQRKVAVHVNLQPPQKVKLVGNGLKEIAFIVSAGEETESLIKDDPYYVKKRTDPTERTGSWGLQYFALFHPEREIGFHSNLCYPKRGTLCKQGMREYCNPTSELNTRVRYGLVVDGQPRSHGCVRLFDSDAQHLFAAVINGTPVYVYKTDSQKKSGSITPEEGAPLDWIHDALSVAGLFPIIGVLADLVDASIYLIEGNWIAAGISAVSMIPVFGEGAAITKLGVKVTRRAVERVGKEGIEEGFKRLSREKGKKLIQKVTIGAEELYARKLYHELAGEIMPYDQLKKMTSEFNAIIKMIYPEDFHALRLDAHHIIEARSFNQFRSDFQKIGWKNHKEMPAIAVHYQYHIRSAEKLLGKGPKSLTKELIETVDKQIYGSVEEMIEAYEAYYRRTGMWSAVEEFFTSVRNALKP